MSARRDRWNLPYAAHLGVLTRELPLFRHSVGTADPIEQLRYVADLGLAGIADNYLRERSAGEQSSMGSEAARAGLRFSSFIGQRPGATNLPWHKAGAEARAAILDDMARAVETAARLGVDVVSIVAQLDRGVPASLQLDALAGHLDAASVLAGKAGVRIGLEPVSSLRVPDLLVRHMGEAAAVVDRIGSPFVGIVFDTFHVHTMDGDVARQLRLHAGRIVAIQIADYPSRHEPGTGEIDFRSFLETYEELGLSMPIELEHFHSGSGAHGERRSLGRLRALDAALGH